MKNKILAITAIGEAAFGLLVVAVPSLAVHALFGLEVDGVGITMSRIAGVALIGLAVACWPTNSGRQQLYGMLTYSVLVTLYLLRIGIRGAPVGPLLWPAVIVHTVLIILLVIASFRARKPAPA